jgi:hypothetical protein
VLFEKSTVRDDRLEVLELASGTSISIESFASHLRLSVSNREQLFRILVRLTGLLSLRLRCSSPCSLWTLCG